MKIEQRDLGLCGLGQLQREIDGDTRRAGATLGAANRDDMSATIGLSRRLLSTSTCDMQ